MNPSVCPHCSTFVDHEGEYYIDEGIMRGHDPFCPTMQQVEDCPICNRGCTEAVGIIDRLVFVCPEHGEFEL